MSKKKNNPGINVKEIAIWAGVFFLIGITTNIITEYIMYKHLRHFRNGNNVPQQQNLEELKNRKIIRVKEV